LNKHSEHKQFSLITNLFWKFLERGGTSGISFIMQLVLARLLIPSDYGIVALVFVFISVASIFVQGGIGTSLIQKKEIDNTDITSIFYLSLLISIILYLLLYLSAPYIADIYSNPILIKVIRVLSISLIIGSLTTVQTAILSRRMQFKVIFICNTSATILSGVIGIVLAYLGFGVWALVYQQLVRRLAMTIILAFPAKIKFTKKVSLSKVKVLYSFGWKLMVANFISTIYTNLRGLIIAKKFSAETLGFYDKGANFPYFITSNISSTIQTVLLPALALNQDTPLKIKSMTQRAVITTSFFIFPIMGGLIAISEPIVLLILTEKWLPAVPFIKILSISYALTPIIEANLQSYNAIGRSDSFLKVEIINRGVGIVILTISLFFGIYGIIIGEVIGEFFALAVVMITSSILINYEVRQQFIDILPHLLLTIAMVIAIYPISLLKTSLVLVISLQTIVGAIFYFGIAWILKLESFSYLISILKQLKNS